MKTHTKYPLTLAAAKKRQDNEAQDSWDLGDALLIECPLDSERGKLLEVARCLQENGCEYNESTLGMFRRVAAEFPKARRLALAFSVHFEAGSPDMLDAIVKGAPKGTPITVAFVQRIVQRIRDHEQRRLRERQAKAQAELEAAEAEEERARQEEAKAKGKAEREAAVLKRQEAKARTKAARETRKVTKAAPRKKFTAPKKEDVPKLVAEAQFIAHASRSVALAREAAKDIKTCLDELTAVGIAALTEQALEAANAWTEASQVVRSRVIDQRGHLSIVGD
jgi:hypothetical protein